MIALAKGGVSDGVIMQPDGLPINITSRFFTAVRTRSTQPQTRQEDSPVGKT